MGAKYLARSSQIAARMLGGEMMIMSPLDSTFFTLNEVATVIWQAADGKTGVLVEDPSPAAFAEGIGRVAQGLMG